MQNNYRSWWLLGGLAVVSLGPPPATQTVQNLPKVPFSQFSATSWATAGPHGTLPATYKAPRAAKPRMVPKIANHRSRLRAASFTTLI